MPWRGMFESEPYGSKSSVRQNATFHYGFLRWYDCGGIIMGGPD